MCVITTNGNSINTVLTRTYTRDASTVTAGTGSDAAGVGALLSSHKPTSLKSPVIIYDRINQMSLAISSCNNSLHLQRLSSRMSRC